MKNKNEILTQLFINIAFVIICFLIVIPFVLVVAISLSSESDIAVYGYEFIPRNPTLEAYKYVFKNPQSILDAYKVTIAFSVLGTFITVLFTAMLAYPLSQKFFKGRKYMSFYLYFTCLFSGGLVPTYLLNAKYLHLADSFWIYILPGCVSAINVFMMRTFFQDIPGEITESAFMDGANDYVIFFRFIIPLSKPVIITQQDIRAVQLAKGAIRAGIQTVLKIAGVSLSQLECMIISGGFGNTMNINSAVKIGLLPAETKDKVRVIGNGALAGASMLL